MRNFSVGTVKLMLPVTLAGLIGCGAAQQRTQQAHEVAELRREVAALKARTESLEGDIEAREAAMQREAERREQALEAELEALRAHAAQRKVDEALTATTPEAAPAAEPARTRMPQGRRPVARQAAEEPATNEGGDPSAKVRELMATIASRLQTASESASGNPVAQERVAAARERLMEADRAAAQNQWDKARQLAEEAKSLLKITEPTPEVSDKPAGQARHARRDTRQPS